MTIKIPTEAEISELECQLAFSNIFTELFTPFEVGYNSYTEIAKNIRAFSDDFGNGEVLSDSDTNLTQKYEHSTVEDAFDNELAKVRYVIHCTLKLTGIEPINK